MQKTTVNSENSQLKSAIWIYFWLWVFEGALRKWVFPGLSNPLLVVRDPVAIYICYLAIRQKIYLNSYVIIGIMCMLIGIVLALLIGHQNLIVGLFGARIFLFHFPLIFIIGNVFNQEDVYNFGKYLLILMLPMAILIILQFLSPQSAWVNRGIGGNLEGAGFSGAMGYNRPPGLFSFISGLVSYIKLLAPFIIYFWLDQKKCPKWLLYSSSFALLIALPLTISRAAVASVLLSVLFGIVSVVGDKKKIFNIFSAFLILVGISIILVQFELFNLGLEVFLKRFENSSNSEGNVSGIAVNRVLGGMLNGFLSLLDQPLFSGNLGYGSNVGARLISGSRTFLAGESTFGQIAQEMGLVMGFIIISIRATLAFNLTIKSWFLNLKGYSLPWLILSNAFLSILSNSFNQPTTLGFTVLIGGILVASTKYQKA